MGHADRGPPDFAASDEQLLRVLRGAIATPVSYRNGDGNGSGNGFQKWALGAVATLVVMGVGGIVAMYGRLSAIEISVQDLRVELTDLKQFLRTKP